MAITWNPPLPIQIGVRHIAIGTNMAVTQTRETYLVIDLVNNLVLCQSSKALDVLEYVARSKQ